MFWDMCPRTLEIWQRNFNYEIQEKADMQDALAWSIGEYVLEAIAAAFDKNTKYPTEPRYMSIMRSEQEEADHQVNEVAASKFWQWAELYNKKNFEGVDDGRQRNND